ncbi:unnamed protein product [Linum tenue]|uniref:Uncharacterized protein n=1 Tax=Linum tenue TaxID=586396 RepID=A0AAV0ISE2_9ROSI|nr:unnamed protein product [Linum tenue]
MPLDLHTRLYLMLLKLQIQVLELARNAAGDNKAKEIPISEGGSKEFRFAVAMGRMKRFGMEPWRRKDRWRRKWGNWRIGCN